MNLDDKYEGFTKPVDGKLTFHNEPEESVFNTFLEKHEGKNLWLELRNKTPTRSQRQNRFYWKYMEKLAELTGHHKSELHTEFKHQLLPWTKKEGIDNTYKEQPSTKHLSKQEFNDYIRKIEEATGVSAPSRKRYDL